MRAVVIRAFYICFGVSIALYAGKPSDAASLASWSTGLSVYSSFQNSGTNGSFGVRPLAVDDYDGLDQVVEPGARIYIGAFHERGSGGWTGTTGFYRVDYRYPLLQVGDTTTWRLCVWADPAVPQAASVFWFNFGYANLGTLEDALRLTLTLVSTPAGVDGAPPAGTVYPLPQTTSLPPFPVYRTDNGLEGYVFDLTATVVPEPSTLLALSAGLAGMAAVWRRTRER